MMNKPGNVWVKNVIHCILNKIDTKQFNLIKN